MECVYIKISPAISVFLMFRVLPEFYSKNNLKWYIIRIPFVFKLKLFLARGTKFFLPLLCPNSFLPVSQFPMHSSKRTARESGRPCLSSSYSIQSHSPALGPRLLVCHSNWQCLWHVSGWLPSEQLTDLSKSEKVREGSCGTSCSFIYRRRERQRDCSGSRQNFQKKAFARRGPSQDRQQ